jgi:hypothetical protein
MNWSKNVYTFMLGAIIVLSGCMGAGTTDGQDADDAEATTVINNYYWNNTTTEVITELPEMIALGGFVTSDIGGAHNITATINTTAGQMIQIIEAEAECIENCHIYWESVCSEGASFGPILLPAHLDGDGSYVDGNMPGSALDCTHTVDVYAGWVQAQDVSWSLVYSIVPVTVG